MSDDREDEVGSQPSQPKFDASVEQNRDVELDDEQIERLIEEEIRAVRKEIYDAKYGTLESKDQSPK